MTQSTIVHLDGYTNTVIGPAVAAVSDGTIGVAITGNVDGDMVLTGTPASETITAYGFNNVITADGGNDTIASGAGLATVVVSDANGNNVIDGSLGNSKVTLGNGTNTITLGGYGNSITVGSGTGNVINAGKGNETVSIAGGTASVTAGGDGDSFLIGGGTVSLAGMVGRATVTLGATFGATDSVDLVGTANDTFTFVNGVLMVSNPDTSTYATIDPTATGSGLSYAPDNNGGVIITLGNNTGTTGVTPTTPTTPVVTTPAPVIQPNVITETQGGVTLAIDSGDRTVHLTGYGNTVTGGDGSNTIDGALGQTGITLGNGNQTISMLGFNNTVTVGDGNSVIVGPQGNSTITTGAGDQTIVLFGYGNTVNIGSNSDPDGSTGKLSFVNAGDGNATVTAHDGTNVILAGGYGDTISVGKGLNLIFDSADVMSKIVGGTLPANPGNPGQALGGSTIILGTGTNYAYLNGYGNTIHSTGGTDAVWGGTGNDTFSIDAGGGALFVSQFSLDNGDKLDLSKVLTDPDFSKDLSAISVSSVTMNSAFQAGVSVNDTLLTVHGTAGTTTSIFLENTNITSASDLVAHNSVIL